MEEETLNETGGRNDRADCASELFVCLSISPKLASNENEQYSEERGEEKLNGKGGDEKEGNG
jgi:hypothetical protein